MMSPRFADIPIDFKDYPRDASILGGFAVVFWWAFWLFAFFVSCARAKDILLGVPWPHRGAACRCDVDVRSPAGCTLSGGSAVEPESQMSGKKQGNKWIDH